MSASDTEITKAIEERKYAIFSSESEMAVDNISRNLDRDWVMGSFMMGVLNDSTLDKVDIQNRTWTSAELTFIDTSLGGSYAINPRPQFTRYADIRVKGQVPGREDTSVMHGNDVQTAGPGSLSLGVGRYYKEAIDEPSQIIHMRFGTPEFNSLTQFFTSFFSEDAARVARTGRVTSAFFSIGNFAGTVVNVLYWPLLAAHAVGVGLRFLFKKPSSRFYYSRPAMPTYWVAVTNMVNQIAVNKGMYPWAMDKATDQVVGQPYKVDAQAMKAISDAMPDIFSENGGIDVYAVANKAQRMKRHMEMKMAENLNNAEDFTGFVKKLGQDKVQMSGPKLGIADYLKKWYETEVSKITEKTDVEASLRTDGKAEAPDKWADFLQAELDDGGAWASFKVDYTGPVSESFSNTAVESDLARKFNETSGGNKAFYFASAGGNVTEATSAITGALMDFTKGVLNSFGASGLVSLAGSAFVDIPKHWENSSANMPRTSYTMQLVSPYGNTISQMINMYIPLCMLLTAALPKSAGKQSYTWPFLVELYDKGRQQTRLGMIDSLSVTRGTTNLGFNKAGEAMGIEVTFSVLDLSNVVSVPISAGFSLNPTSVFDDDNMYTDYMNVLSSLSLNQQIYTTSKLRLRLAQKMKTYQYMISKSRVAGVLHNIPVVGDIDLFYKGTER